MLARSIASRMPSTIAKNLVAAYSTAAEDDVLFSTIGRRGLITLNRPKQLNALNHSMVLKMYPKLKEWRNDKELIVVKGNSPKSFCAGGDVVAITKDRTGQNARDYFRTEYSNNGLIASLKTPYLAIIHGIVMGGGVGVSIHGKYRVATETSLFAMPETQIGLFPDVGVSHFLARMPHSLGMFLAMSGHRLKGFDLVHTGIATHFCLSELLPELEAEVLKENTNVDQVLKSFHSKSIQRLADGKEPIFSLSPHLNTISTIFSAPSVEQIITGLQKNKNEFTTSILNLLGQMSPLSLKVTHRQINITANLDVYETLNQDFRLAWRLLAQNDFYEGVRALLVDKDRNPKWIPSQLSDITDAQVDQFFEPLKPQEELNLPKILNE